MAAVVIAVILRCSGVLLAFKLKLLLDLVFLESAELLRFFRSDLDSFFCWSILIFEDFLDSVNRGLDPWFFREKLGLSFEIDLARMFRWECGEGPTFVLLVDVPVKERETVRMG